MTSRSSSAEMLRADEMRAHVIGRPLGWRTLTRPERHEYDPAQFTITSDDRRQPLELRDPRAVELELRELRLAFWECEQPGLVRLIARRCVVLERHLARRCTCHDADGFRLLPDDLARA